jgi:hypothetical protein
MRIPKNSTQAARRAEAPKNPIFYGFVVKNTFILTEKKKNKWLCSVGEGRISIEIYRHVGYN